MKVYVLRQSINWDGHDCICGVLTEENLAIKWVNEQDILWPKRKAVMRIYETKDLNIIYDAEEYK